MEDKARLQRSFGRDFLTYLCYLTDTQAGRLTLEDPAGDCFVWIDNKIVFEDESASPPSTLSYTGENLSTHDLKQALRSGKRVKEARLRIEKGQNSWTFTLKADRLDIAGLKIDMPGSSDPEERLFGRISCIEALNCIIDGLYGMFVKTVFGKSWKTHGYGAFQKWLHARSEEENGER